MHGTSLSFCHPSRAFDLCFHRQRFEDISKLHASCDLSHLDSSRTVCRGATECSSSRCFRDDISKCTEITIVIATIFAKGKLKQTSNEAQQRKDIVRINYISFISLYVTLLLPIFLSIPKQIASKLCSTCPMIRLTHQAQTFRLLCSTLFFIFALLKSIICIDKCCSGRFKASVSCLSPSIFVKSRALSSPLSLSSSSFCSFYS